MNINFLNLKKRVMARIYLEYTKNAFREYFDYFMFALFVVTSFFLISIRDVFNNMPKDNFMSTFNFFWAALRGTSLVIQALIAGFLIRAVVGSAILVHRNYKVIGKNIGDKFFTLTAKFRY